MKEGHFNLISYYYYKKKTSFHVILVFFKLVELPNGLPIIHNNFEHILHLFDHLFTVSV